MQLRKESLKKNQACRYCRGQDWNPGKPDFFRLSFRNCISCVNNCEDLLYIYLNLTQLSLSTQVYEIHTFELRNEEINVKKILAVINAIYAVAKRKPEKKSGLPVLQRSGLESRQA